MYAIYEQVRAAVAKTSVPDPARLAFHPKEFGFGRRLRLVVGGLREMR